MEEKKKKRKKETLMYASVSQTGSVNQCRAIVTTLQSNKLQVAIQAGSELSRKSPSCFHFRLC